MSITVLVPTKDRPEYLFDALQSIVKQSYLHKVDNVIVSENGTTNASKAVCDKFKNLKITYIKQEKQYNTSVEHFYWLINQSQSMYTAMLHDDDWWYPTHLETAINALKIENCVCYFSNFILTNNQILQGASFHHPSIIGYVADNNSFTDLVLLSFEEIATLCYLYTPFHMSSMVAKTSILKEANNTILQFSEPWYVDRALYPFVGLHGTIAFNPQILCGVRMHDHNDANTINLTARYNAHKEGSEKIKTLAFSKGIDVTNNWKKRKINLTDSDWYNVQNTYQLHFGKTDDALFSYPSEENNPKPQRITFKKIIINILPFGVVRYLQDLRLRTK